MSFLRKNEARMVYNAGLAGPRSRFARSRVMRKMLSWNAPPDLVNLFIIHFNALNTGMAAPISRYVYEAGVCCRKLGLDEMSDYFAEHSREESGHDHWALSDTYRSVAGWNTSGREPCLNVEEILGKRDSRPVRTYHSLHEEILEGNAPYAVLAIATEIERITVRYGPRMLLHCLCKLGRRSTAGLTFVSKHVCFDIAHTQENNGTLDWLIGHYPETAAPLIEAGTRALAAYQDFLEYCLYESQKIIDLTSFKTFS